MSVSILRVALVVTGRIVGMFGAMVFALNCYGAWIAPHGSSEPFPARSVENYHFRTLPVSEAKEKFASLLSAREQLSQKELAERLFSLVSQSFVHNQQYVLKPWDNIVFWISALTADDTFKREVMLDTQNAELLWNRGAGFCHQASWVYVQKARELGLDARLLRLPGHYVSEVLIPEHGWVTVDADLGVFWGEPYERISLRERLEYRASLLEQLGFSKEKSAQLAALYVDPSVEKIYRRSFLYWKDLHAEELLHYNFRWKLALFLLGAWVLGEVVQKRSFARQK
jgi:hypothetical protein